MKIKVRIHTPSGLKIEKHKLSYDGKKVLIRKEAKKKPAWNPEIQTLETRRNFLGMVTYWVDVFPEAEKTFLIDPKQASADMPKWDKVQSKRYIEAKLLEKAGQEPKEKSSNSALWIIAILVVANIAIQVLLSGRVHIG